MVWSPNYKLIFSYPIFFNPLTIFILSSALRATSKQHGVLFTGNMMCHSIFNQINLFSLSIFNFHYVSIPTSPFSLKIN